MASHDYDFATEAEYDDSSVYVALRSGIGFVRIDDEKALEQITVKDIIDAAQTIDYPVDIEISHRGLEFPSSSFERAHDSWKLIKIIVRLAKKRGAK